MNALREEWLFQLTLSPRANASFLFRECGEGKDTRHVVAQTLRQPGIDLIEGVSTFGVDSAKSCRIPAVLSFLTRLHFAPCPVM